MKTHELKKILRKNKCYFLRDGGNHEIWYSPMTQKAFPVWYHKKEIPTGTAKQIFKEAGIKQ